MLLEVQLGRKVLRKGKIKLDMIILPKGFAICFQHIQIELVLSLKNNKNVSVSTNRSIMNSLILILFQKVCICIYYHIKALLTTSVYVVNLRWRASWADIWPNIRAL